MYFFTFDYGLFFLVKITRKDFWYWLRIDNTLAAFVVSVLMRVTVKFVSDATGLNHLRHPYEVGGLQYTLSVLLTFIFSFTAVRIYS